MKADRLSRFALQNRRAFLNLTGRNNSDELHPDQIAATQLAVDGQVEESQISMVLGQLKPKPDRPDMFWLERSLLSQDAPLFQAGRRARITGKFDVSMTDPPIRHALPQRQLDDDTATYHEMLRHIRGQLRADFTGLPRTVALTKSATARRLDAVNLSIYPGRRL